MSLKDHFKNVPFFFVLIPVILTVIGLVFLYSTGINPDGSNNGQYLRQLLWIAVGLAAAVLILNIDYYRLVETSNVYYIAGIVFLVVTFVFGRTIRGSRSWLGFAGLGIQPSEIMKICYILFFAKYLSNAPILEKKNRVFLISLGIFILPLGLVLIQPDLGTALVFISIFFIMSFLGMADNTFTKYMLAIGGIAAAILLGTAFYKYRLENGGAPIEVLEILFSFNTLFIVALTMFLYSAAAILIDFFSPVAIVKKLLPVTLVIGTSFFFSAMAIRVLRPYQWKRILVMISPEFDRSGAGYNIIQSKIAIGSGGFFGKGLFRGTQNTLGFLPEKSTDFIYAIISEELGFLGAGLVMALFVFYFFYMIRTIQNAKDKEGMLVSAGILAMFFTHFAVNVGMTLGVTPATGLPLPFISYGGSAYITNIIAAALLLNIYSRRFVH